MTPGGIIPLWGATSSRNRGAASFRYEGRHHPGIGGRLPQESANAKRVWRLYREMGLQLRNKAPKRRVQAKLREGRLSAVGPNDVWAMDFVHDQLFDGRKIRALTIIDTFTRLSPAIDVRQSYRGADVVATLERAAIELGLPKTIRLDNGPEFVSKELDLWAFVRHAPGFPERSATRLREADLNVPFQARQSRLGRAS